jgi:predicted acetyltransferase
MSESPPLVTQLLKVVVAYGWFFETCDESVVDDDTAIKQQEYAGYLLYQLSDMDKRRLVDELTALAESETDPAYREFVETFAFAMGLVESEGG